MKVLARKMKNFKILAIFENFLKNLGALNQNSGPTEIFVLVQRTHSENLKVLTQKLREEFQNNRKPPFRGVKKKRRSLKFF